MLRCRPLPRDAGAHGGARGPRAPAPTPSCTAATAARAGCSCEGIEPSNTLLVYYLDKSHPDVFVVAGPGRRARRGPAAGDVRRRHRATWSALRAAPRARRWAARRGSSAPSIPRPGSGSSTCWRRRWARRRRWRFLQERWGVARRGDARDRRQLERPRDAGAGGAGPRDGQRRPRDAARWACRCCPTNDEDGVAVAIERHVLGRKRRLAVRRRPLTERRAPEWTSGRRTLGTR